MLVNCLCFLYHRLKIQDLAALFRQLLQVEGIVGQEIFSQLQGEDQKPFSYDCILGNPALIIEPLINGLKPIAESGGYGSLQNDTNYRSAKSKQNRAPQRVRVLCTFAWSGHRSLITWSTSIHLPETNENGEIGEIGIPFRNCVGQIGFEIFF